LSNGLENFTIYVDETGSYTYVGWAPRGSLPSSSVWRIMRVDESSATLTLVEWADGEDKFNKVWDNRATYTYK